jgi:uncharacterized protein
MRCRYCFYSNVSEARETASYGIMKQETAEKIIDNVFMDINKGDELTFIFQGGEPSIAGLTWYKNFITYVKQHNKDAIVNYAFQTNGLLLDDNWCEFFRENNFLLGLSIDAGKRFHDRNRLSANGSSTWEACMATKSLLEKNKVEYNILCVLTNDLANEPDKVWNFIISENIRYIQFIPCLEPLSDDKKYNMYPPGTALRPMQFAKFYSRLLYYWIPEFENNNYISIKLFDDVVNYFLKGIQTVCGINGKCQNQYVLEADGSVYPCDFYCIDRYKIGNLTQSTPGELFYTDKVKEFLFEKPESAAICRTCGFLDACQGGCKRMRKAVYAGAGGAVCGFRIFLEKGLEKLKTSFMKMQYKYEQAGVN